jgi:hypothetical protein
MQYRKIYLQNFVCAARIGARCLTARQEENKGREETALEYPGSGEQKIKNAFIVIWSMVGRQQSVERR